MPTELKERCQHVLTKIKVPRKDKKDIRFFLVSGDEPFHWGSLESDAPSIIGLPWNFVYNKIADIEISDIRVFGDQTANWDSRWGKKLLESLVLTDDEKKFAIGREIYMLDSYRRVISPAILFVCVSLGLMVKAFVNQHPSCARYSPLMKKGIKGATALFTIINFVALRDMMSMHYEMSADQRAADLDTEYYDGAMSYYTKLLQRGKAYRALMGEDEGPKYFTAEGDERRPIWQHLFISRSTPFTNRIKILNDRKNAHYEGE